VARRRAREPRSPQVRRPTTAEGSRTMSSQLRNRCPDDLPAAELLDPALDEVERDVAHLAPTGVDDQAVTPVAHRDRLGHAAVPLLPVENRVGDRRRRGRPIIDGGRSRLYRSLHRRQGRRGRRNRRTRAAGTHATVVRSGDARDGHGDGVRPDWRLRPRRPRPAPLPFWPIRMWPKG
jgi:hypothetical protein